MDRLEEDSFGSHEFVVIVGVVSCIVIRIPCEVIRNLNIFFVQPCDRDSSATIRALQKIVRLWRPRQDTSPIFR
jgi:hypothetical protein